VEFGWLNASGAVISGLLLVPSGAFLGRKHQCPKQYSGTGRGRLLRNVGGCAALFLMVLPLGAPGGSFGFVSVGSMILWLSLCILLIVAYYLCWLVSWIGRDTPGLSLALTVIPCLLFLGRGIVLRHWLLCLAGVAFLTGHVWDMWEEKHRQMAK
jgi:hypothetical protein